MKQADNQQTNREETQEVFDDVNLMAAVLFLFLLQLLNYSQLKSLCTC